MVNNANPIAVIGILWSLFSELTDEGGDLLIGMKYVAVRRT